MKKSRRKKKKPEQPLKMQHGLALSILAHIVTLALLIAAAWWQMPAERPGAALFVDDIVVGDGEDTGDAPVPKRSTPKAAIKSPSADTLTRSTHDDDTAPGVADTGRDSTDSGSASHSGIGSGNTGSGSPVLAEIIRRIEQSKRYPEQARLMHQEGTIGLRFVIQSNGQPTQITVMQSSNIPILDAAAKNAIERSAPLPQYPQAIELTLRFHLR